MKRKLIFGVFLCLALGTALVWAGGGQDGAKAAGPVTIEFMQWWQPEMKAGSFEKVISDFEAKNPNIKVKAINLPYAEVLNQITIGCASGTLSDVVGIEPNWLYDMIKQNMVEPLDDYIARDNYDLNQIASILVLNNKKWIFPVTTFLYPVYYNVEYFNAAGLTTPPKNWTEFIEYSRKLTVESKNQYGWVIPLSLSAPNGVKNEILAWAWAGGNYYLKNDLPNLDTPAIKAAINHIATLYREKLVVPGAFTKVEQEKVEDFSSGRSAMMISSMAHINLMKTRNPNLRFDIFQVPVPDGYTGKPGLSMASWTVGIGKPGKNKESAWALVKHLLDKDQNSFICSNANAFPGNKNSKPDFVSADPLFAKAFDMYQKSDLINEFQGQPNVVNGLQRSFMEELHAMLEGKQNVDDMLRKTQAKWLGVYGK
jgi:multiple sugar transport system substrate-binding protein